jgi:hypothetical protein
MNESSVWNLSILKFFEAKYIRPPASAEAVPYLFETTTSVSFQKGNIHPPSMSQSGEKSIWSLNLNCGEVSPAGPDPYRWVTADIWEHRKSKSKSERVFKVRNFRTRTSEKSADSDSDLDVRKALDCIYIAGVYCLVPALTTGRTRARAGLDGARWS